MALTNIQWRPDTRGLHVFALTLAIGFGLIALAAWVAGGYWQTWRIEGVFHWRPLAWWWSPALAVLILARIHAPLVKPVYWVWMGLAFVMGNLVGYLLLGVFFFAVMTPIGLALRVFGHDPLRLRPMTADTYWIARSSQPTRASRSRLF